MKKEHHPRKGSHEILGERERRFRLLIEEFCSRNKQDFLKIINNKNTKLYLKKEWYFHVWKYTAVFVAGVCFQIRENKKDENKVTSPPVVCITDGGGGLAVYSPEKQNWKRNSGNARIGYTSGYSE